MVLILEILPHAKAPYLPYDFHLIVRINIHPVNQRVSQPSRQTIGPSYLPRQLSPGAFCFFIHLHLRGLRPQIGADLPQSVKLAVNSGLFAFVALYGDLLQNELLIQRPFLIQTAVDLLVIFGLFRKPNIQHPGVGEVSHIQNDLCLCGENFVQCLFQLRFHNRHAMAGGRLIHLAVPTQEVVVFVRCPGHSMAAAATEHFVPQGVGIGVLLRCLEPGPLGLHLIE